MYYFSLQSVYMDSIKHFPRRIQEILDVMIEKELRVVAPFDEAELLFKSKELSAGMAENKPDIGPLKL